MVGRGKTGETKMTVAKQLKITVFPLEFTVKTPTGSIKYSENSDGYWYKYEYNPEGLEVYYENSEGYWYKREYNTNGLEVYYENYEGYWYKQEYNDKGLVVYCENSNEFWYKREYNDKGLEVYFENSDGVKRGNKPNQVVTLSMAEAASKLGIPPGLLRIKG